MLADAQALNGDLNLRKTNLLRAAKSGISVDPANQLHSNRLMIRGIQGSFTIIQTE